MPYYGTGEAVRTGDVVRWRQGRDELQGEIARRAKDDAWCDVRYYTGPGSLYPEIDHATRRVSTFRLHLVRRAEQGA